MIQRIQSLYLFIAFVLLTVGAVLFAVNVWPTKTAEVAADYSIFHTGYPLLGFLFPAFLMIAALISLFVIFKFKKRMFQVRLIMFGQLSIVVAFLIFLIPFIANTSLGFEWNVKLILPLIAFVFDVLARRAIIKDEKLVRATDRIR